MSMVETLKQKRTACRKAGQSVEMGVLQVVRGVVAAPAAGVGRRLTGPTGAGGAGQPAAGSRQLPRANVPARRGGFPPCIDGSAPGRRSPWL
jgi:hypothetical protein